MLTCLHDTKMYLLAFLPSQESFFLFLLAFVSLRKAIKRHCRRLGKHESEKDYHIIAH